MMNMTLPHPCRVTSAGADQRKLYPAAEIITSTFPSRRGYYHRELDGIVTYSPRARYGNKTGTRISEDHPAVM